MGRVCIVPISKLIALVTAGLGLSVGGGLAWAGDLVILTSFPPAFYEVISEKFEKAHPDINIEIVQRSTTSGVRFLLERDTVDVDIFWASSPDAFELLKDREQLARVDVETPLQDSSVAGYPVNDADGRYFGFAFSTFGAAYNPHYLARFGLPVPRTWNDLTEPAYQGHVGISAPSRSGTSHFIVEAILQTFGWDKGWRMMSRLGGNLSTITARSFGIADGIEQGRFGIGPSIDFLATVERSSDSIAFVVLEPLFLVPASVAVLERSTNRAAAVAFVQFLLSTDVQLLLMSPQMGRIPVIDELRTLALASRGTRLPEPTLVNGTSFDANLSARRYGLVNAIFDEWIVAHRQELSERWTALNALAAGDRDKLIDLLAGPPVSEARSLEITASPTGHGRVSAASLSEDPVIAQEIRDAVSERLTLLETELDRATGDERGR